MSTNYYALRDVCPHCSRPAERLHIGKSSGGWRFSMARWTEAYADTPLMTLADWRAYLERDDITIRDESDRDVWGAQFWNLIDAKSGGRPHTDGWDGYAGHPEGWRYMAPVADGPVDLMPVNGEFS